MRKRNWAKFNVGVVEEFRANNGSVRGKGPLILLTTTGAKTGELRVTPLLYSQDGDDIILIASRAGESRNPDWYYNLVANPIVTVECGTEHFQARARVTEGEERDRRFAIMAARLYIFDKYQRKTTRRIPLIVLERLP